MAGAEVGCLDEHPLDVVAELVQVADDLIEAEGQMPPDVLEHDHWGAKDRDGVADVGPEVSLVLLPQTPPGLTERLARVSARDDVHARDGRPVDGGDVAQVGDVGEAAGKDLASALVDVGHPRDTGVEDGFDGQIETAHAGEQGADGEGGGPVLCGACHDATSVRSCSSLIVRWTPPPRTPPAQRFTADRCATWLSSRHAPASVTPSSTARSSLSKSGFDAL